MNTTQPPKESSQTPTGQLKSYHQQFQPIQHQPPTLSFISKASALEAGRINATATHFELDQSPNCVSSLITMSCRGRAEAFARSLQSRLRTLGSHGDHQEIDTVDSSDPAWVNGNNIISSSNSLNNVNNIAATTITREIQPRPTSLTAESADSYFDFDMEPESPGSPIDECEYTRLIETSVSTPQEQQAPESGFVCASPCSTLEGESRGSASSSEVQFFDPESSDTGTEFFDCPVEQIRTPRRYQHLSHHRVAVKKPPSPPIAASPSSSSESSTTPTSKTNGHVRLLDSSAGECDSSDSFPPSQQSTNSSISAGSKLNSNSNSNSTLQDAEEDIQEDVDVASTEVKIDQEEEEGEEEGEKFTASLYDVSKAIFFKFEGDDDAAAADEGDATEAATLKQEEIDEKAFDQNEILQQITTVEGPIVERVDVAKEAKPEKAQSLENKVSGEEEYERVPRVRRCSSLKTGKTPPGTPGRKKIVRFADVLGLDLADVRTFLDEVPKIPKSAYEDLDITMPQQIQLGPPLEKVLVPLFQQPGCLPGFIDRLRDNQVCLESAAVTDPVSLTITGCVRVRNLDFHKSVHVRYSLDSWRTYSDLTASYVENSCDGFSDKFSFMMFGNSMQVGQRVEMAIRFQAKGEQFWDSNYGANYCFQCLPCSSRHSGNTTVVKIDINQTSVQIDRPILSTLESITTHTDAMGSCQWSNTFLY